MNDNQVLFNLHPSRFWEHITGSPCISFLIDETKNIGTLQVSALAR